MFPWSRSYHSTAIGHQASHSTFLYSIYTSARDFKSACTKMIAIQAKEFEGQLSILYRWGLVWLGFFTPYKSLNCCHSTAAPFIVKWTFTQRQNYDIIPTYLKCLRSVCQLDLKTYGFFSLYKVTVNSFTHLGYQERFSTSAEFTLKFVHIVKLLYFI